MKDCKQIIKHIPDFLAGNLNQLKSGQINQHLKSCLTCQVEIESLSSIWQKLSALPEDKPDESLKIRFNNMLDVYKLGMKQKTEPIVLRTIFKKLFVSWQIKQPFLQFASVILLVLIGLVSGYSLHPLISKENKVEQLQTEMANLQEMVAVNLLKQESASDRLQGVIWGAKVADQHSNILTELMTTLNNDPNVNVRLAAANALYLYRNNPHIKEGLINSLTLQDSPLVQIALVDLLVEIKEEKALSALKELIKANHLNPEVKKRAELGINQLM